MSDEHAPTGGDGGQPNHGSAVPAGSNATGDELDALLAALADGTRRRVLASLEEADGENVALSDLVERVADDPAGDSPADRERVAVSLHHTHLPKLADAGVVEYDPHSGTVRYRGGPVVAEWLALVRSRESGHTDS